MRAIGGLHAIEEYLRLAAGGDQGTGAGFPANVIYCRSSKRIETILALAKEAGVKASRADQGELDARVGSASHRGVVLEIPGPSTRIEDLRSFLSGPLPAVSAILALDGVTDPHNLGAVLRSADQFGADLVVIPSRRSAQLGDTVYRTSAGAAFQVPTVTVVNLTRALLDLKEAGYWIYGADVSGVNVVSAGLAAKSVVVLGSEGKGLSRLVAERCDALVRIPSFGAIDSLNVSVAAGVLLYELRRQQGLFAD
jgi:23S rRNA (guanosine2251-2'-O)-methyltransferase